MIHRMLVLAEAIETAKQADVVIMNVGEAAIGVVRQKAAAIFICRACRKN